MTGGAEAAFMLCLVHPDTLALAPLVDPLAHRFDDACAIAVGNHEAIVQQVRECARAFLDV